MPFEWFPSPQSIVAVKSDAVDPGLASVNVAITPLKVVPSTSVGELTLAVKAASVTVKVCGAEVPPPGPGLETVRDRLVSSARLAAGIVVCNCVLLKNVVAIGAPLSLTIEVLIKFVPLTMIVRAALPSGAEATLKLVVVGTGLTTAMLFSVLVRLGGAVS